MLGSFISILLTAGGFLLGALAGFVFGKIQNAALVRNKKLLQSGKLAGGLSVIPGSMRRIVFLLIVLALFQLAFPVLFRGNGIQWLISAGVVLGYGWTHVQQLRQRSYTT